MDVVLLGLINTLLKYIKKFSLFILYTKTSVTTPRKVGRRGLLKKIPADTKINK